MKNKMNFDSMEVLVEDQGNALVPFKEGSTCEVTVLDVAPRKITVDVMGLAIGIIPESEFSFDTQELKPGDKVSAYVLSMENDSGFVILSHKRANREAIWETLQAKSDAGELMTVKVTGANRGGLLVEAGGIDGFIPVSQLSADHYPKVQNGSGGEIARRLQELIGQTLKVKVLSADKKTSKLIFSEKSAQSLLQETAVDTVKLGDVLDGTVTGTTTFGLFVNAGGTEGLVHISEVSWDRVANINTLYAVGDSVKIKVIQIDGNRVSFSIKRLQPDPWIKAFEDYKPNTVIEGTITRVTDFGAFVKISEHVAGLCHISQMGESVKDPNKILSVGNKYQFRIISIEPATHRCSLQLVTDKKQLAKKETKPQKALRKIVKVKKVKSDKKK